MKTKQNKQINRKNNYNLCKAELSLTIGFKEKKGEEYFKKSNRNKRK